MNINYPLLSFGWLGGALLGATGVGGYLIYDYKNPTGGQRLLGRGYIFKPPKISGGKIKDNGCFENIFKEISRLDENKLYACGVANIDIYNNVGQFEPKNTTINFLSFNSEIYIRKGNKGWTISTSFDNRGGDARYDHWLKTYTKKQGEVFREDKSFFALIEEIPKEEQIEEGSIKREIFLGSKKLNIKVPGGNWYKEKDYFVQTNREDDSIQFDEETSESFKNSKSWFGIWIQDDRSNSSWIFQDIEIFIEEKRYSQLFCKIDENCFQLRQGEEEPWIDNTQKESVKQIIQQISTSKGEWVDTEKFCKRSRLRNLPPEQLKDLELFCFSKQN